MGIIATLGGIAGTPQMMKSKEFYAYVPSPEELSLNRTDRFLIDPDDITIVKTDSER